MKAGGAYVPIDPEYPAARAELIVADSDVRLLLVDGSHCNVPTGARTLRLEHDIINRMVLLSPTQKTEYKEVRGLGDWLAQFLLGTLGIGFSM